MLPPSSLVLSPQRGGLDLSPIARIDRAHSDCARSASRGDRPDRPSCFHHFQSRIEFMPAGRATDTIRLDRQLVRPDPHAPTIEAPSEVDPLIVYGFVLRATETIHRLPIKQPRVPRVVEHRQRQIMMVHVVFKFLPVGEPVLNQLSPHHLVESVLFHDCLGWTHHVPPVL